MTKMFNRTTELEKRRTLRTRATEAEKIIWDKLRRRNITGFKFRRQYSVGPYIIDFFCPEIKLAVEIDGEVHNSNEAQEYDNTRDEFIKLIGIHILRFKNNEVYSNPEKVIDKIRNTAEEL